MLPAVARSIICPARRHPCAVLSFSRTGSVGRSQAANLRRDLEFRSLAVFAPRPRDGRLERIRTVPRLHDSTADAAVYTGHHSYQPFAREPAFAFHRTVAPFRSNPGVRG